MIRLLLLHHALLLNIFSTEVERAAVPNWAPQLAAQIDVESNWRPAAQSKYATGRAQFTPPTWRDIAPYTSPSCSGKPETDPACSIRSQIVYMRRLMHRYRYAATPADQWAFAWAAYNGGPGWIKKENARCRRRPGCSPSRWWGHVAKRCIRADWACRENWDYPKKILRRIDP